MERRPEQHPAREEMDREHGKSDREGRPAEKEFPPRDFRPEPKEARPHERETAGKLGESRPPSRSGEQPERKFGERRKERSR